MGTFPVEIEIGDPQGERYEPLTVTVDTGAIYTVVPRTVLERLGVRPYRTARFRLADGRVVEDEIGQTWIRVAGERGVRMVVFGDEGAEPVLGADTMEGLLLAPDPVHKRLIHVEGLMLTRLEVDAPKLTVTYAINGESYEPSIEPNRTLLEVVRDDLRLTGAKEGCGTGDCGACSMIVDGKLVTSCLMLAPQADGAQITTIEGLAQDGQLHPLQQAFLEKGAVQCGFCIPGMILAGKTLLDRNPHPSEREIQEAIAGNLCRCTGYTKIVEAIATAAGASA
ncbi:MAG: 2Fe-2S iron-sulfur cluster-binding protein [Dehalococcoidia bacterium]|nr:2Fe-2S iron-sulfur cluster-binding protein [Dehalococcoidia bacterium]